MLTLVLPSRLLCHALQFSFKAISYYIRRATLVNLTGLAGQSNATGDDQKKLDVIGNELFINAMRTSGKCALLVSEEEDEIIFFKDQAGAHYAVACDPIDGSSNLDAGVSVGTIFGIHRLEEGSTGRKEDILKPGSELLAAGFIDQVAVRKDRLDNASSGGTQFTNCRGVPYRAIGIEEDVYIHPSSVVHDHRPPEYVVFNEVVRTSKIWLKGAYNQSFARRGATPLTFCAGITAINPAWLATIGKGSMCTYSKPKKNRAGEDVVIPHFGPDGWELPPVKASLVA